jgi:hypothetical protein
MHGKPALARAVDSARDERRHPLPPRRLGAEPEVTRAICYGATVVLLERHPKLDDVDARGWAPLVIDDHSAERVARRISLGLRSIISSGLDTVNRPFAAG